MSTPKQPVINAVLITYINYSITENYTRKMASFLPYTRPEPLLTVLCHIYLPAISLFVVTSNQKSTFEKKKKLYSRRSESFHSRRNCNCATRNVSKCDAEL